MADTPWKTKDWFVSEWNYPDEVTKDFKLAKNVKVHTLFPYTTLFRSRKSVV